MDAKALRLRMVLAPTPRERERWYAMLLLAQGWTAAATAEALERDRHLKAVVVVLNWLASWKEELKRRCRTVLQSSVYVGPQRIGFRHIGLQCRDTLDWRAKV